jgi:hypothetical protein
VEHTGCGNGSEDLEIVAERKKNLVGKEQDHEGEHNRSSERSMEKSGETLQNLDVITFR